MTKLKTHTILVVRKLDAEGETLGGSSGGGELYAHRERVLSPMINKLERQLQMARENQEDTPDERETVAASLGSEGSHLCYGSRRSRRCSVE